MLYVEVTAVCSEIHKNQRCALCGPALRFLYVKPGVTYSNHCALKG
jgi:hypothetical protein